MDKPTAAAKKPPVTRREIFGWCCFDFANSAYTTVIITVLFSIYFTEVICGQRPGSNTLWAGCLATSQVVVILFAPWLGSVGDALAIKKRFLMGSAIGLVVFTALLYFTGPGTVVLAMALIIIGNTCFSLGENFSASFLPELSTPATAGRISGYGWSFGYVGGLVSLGLCWWVIQQNGGKIDPAIFPMTALFMLAGMSVTALLLQERAVRTEHKRSGSILSAAWQQLSRSWVELPKHKTLFRFFIAFTCFMSGLSAIVVFAAIFAKRELDFNPTELILLFAGLQVSSSVGALVFGYVQDKFGAIKTLSFTLILWVAVGVLSYFCVDKMMFFIVGNIAGLAIGSTQSASRAVVSTLAPPEMAGEVFGYWGVFGKLAAIIGPLAVGTISDLVNLRVGVMSSALFFVGGFVLLQRLPPRDNTEGNATG